MMPTWSDDMMKNWSDTQKHYWNAWNGAGKTNTPDFGVAQMMLENWQRVFSGMGTQAFQQMGQNGFQNGFQMPNSFQMPNGFQNGFQMPMNANWQEELAKIFATPAVGYNRESQERLQALGQLGVRFQEAMDAYMKAFAKPSMGAAGALGTRLAALQAEGKAPQSMREFYDIWVEVNEDVYGKFAMTDEYQVVYGDMVNSLMALKQAMNVEMDSYYASVNLPTRKEMNLAFEKQQEARRENRELRQQLQALTRQVEALVAAQAAPSVVDAPVAAPAAAAKTPRARSKKA